MARRRHRRKVRTEALRYAGARLSADRGKRLDWAHVHASLGGSQHEVAGGCCLSAVGHDSSVSFLLAQTSLNRGRGVPFAGRTPTSGVRKKNQIKPSRPGGGQGKPLNFHKSCGRPGDKLEVRGECLPPAAGGTPQTPQKSFKLESLLWPNHGYIRPALVPRHGLGAWQTGLGALQARHGTLVNP